MAAHALAITADDATAIAILIAAATAAVVSIITAVQNRKQAQATKLPSNTITPGAATENTAVAMSMLVHMLADVLGKKVQLPTPAETQAQAPGATIENPPPPLTDTSPAPPPNAAP